MKAKEIGKSVLKWLFILIFILVGLICFSQLMITYMPGLNLGAFFSQNWRIWLIWRSILYMLILVAIFYINKKAKNKVISPKSIVMIITLFLITELLNLMYVN